MYEIAPALLMASYILQRVSAIKLKAKFRSPETGVGCQESHAVSSDLRFCFTELDQPGYKNLKFINLLA